MRKVFFNFILIVVLTFLFLGCKNDKENNNVSEQKENTTMTVGQENYPQKPLDAQRILDFYNQAGNVLVAIKFKDKDYLKEEWNKALILDIQEKVKEQLGKPNIYTWLVTQEDNLYYELLAYNYSNGEDEVKFSGSLKKGDTVLIKNYDSKDIYFRVKKEKDKNKEESNDIVIFPPLIEEELSVSHEVLTWDKYYPDNQETKVQGVLNKKEKNMEANTPTYADGEVDLDGDGKKEKILFKGDITIYSTEESKKNIGNLSINEQNFSTKDLLEMVEDIQKDEYYTDIELEEIEITDIEILDMDPKDSHKEIILKIPARYELDEDLGIIFHYEDKKLKFIGQIYYGFIYELASVLDYQTNTIAIKSYNYDLDFPYYQTRHYKLENNKIILNTEIEEIKNYTGRVVGIVKKSINLYKEGDSDDLLFKADSGRILLFLETDHKTWVKIKDFETGKEGYIRFKLDTSGDFPKPIFYQQKELENLDFYDVFKNLPNFG